MLPTKKVKKWNTDNARLKADPDKKPLRPNFCPIIHEDTGERCGKMMDMWDQMFYEQYGIGCQECTKKYKPETVKI